jgi:predicted DNA binding CopG/RHH family protein
MKTRSNGLYAYLLQSGVLHGTVEDIAFAKVQYRKMYKRQWKQRRRPRKEIRIEVTLKDFQAIKTAASIAKLKHTTYVRMLILSSLGIKQLIPHKQVLLNALQLISMAVIAMANKSQSRQLLEQLTNAEQILLNYVKGEL